MSIATIHPLSCLRYPGTLAAIAYQAAEAGCDFIQVVPRPTTAQRLPTTGPAAVHLLPTGPSVNRIFEVRRIAEDAGCAFIRTAHARSPRPYVPHGPFTGGAA
ncbi:hypothetical protein ACIPK7_05445 [Pseudomonas sp. NPDC086581]|uniref:hypothetical protein n=1 Tax=Pseudomonas sp. NPDC086581 TaxID=3364432 RepID=UPI0037F60CE3